MPEQQHSETATTTTTETTREERKSSLLTDILTIIGFAILFIIIIWGLVHLVQLFVSSYSNNKPAATIQVNAPAQVTSGQPATISWNYSPAVVGTYAFLYECKSGLAFQASASKDSGIPCGVAYTVGTATSSITVIPELTATSSVGETLSIVFIPQQGGSQVQGNATMTVNPVRKAAATAPVKTTEKKSYAGSYNASGYSTNYSGPAQLSVRIISGTINGNGDGTVTFDIANIGGAPSGTYYFYAQLPTAQPYPYQSPAQAPLAPGSHITSTLNFTDAASGGGLFSVTVEGSGAYGSDDYASMQLTGSYNYNYGYPQAPYLQYPSYTY